MTLPAIIVLIQTTVISEIAGWRFGSRENATKKMRELTGKKGTNVRERVSFLHYVAFD